MVIFIVTGWRTQQWVPSSWLMIGVYWKRGSEKVTKVEKEIIEVGSRWEN